VPGRRAQDQDPGNEKNQTKKKTIKKQQEKTNKQTNKGNAEFHMHLS